MKCSGLKGSRPLTTLPACRSHSTSTISNGENSYHAICSDVNRTTILRTFFSNKLDYANGTISGVNCRQLEDQNCRLDSNHQAMCLIV